MASVEGRMAVAGGEIAVAGDLLRLGAPALAPMGGRHAGAEITLRLDGRRLAPSQPGLHLIH